MSRKSPTICDYSSESYRAVLSFGVARFWMFSKMLQRNRYFNSYLGWGVKHSSRSTLEPVHVAPNDWQLNRRNVLHCWLKANVSDIEDILQMQTQRNFENLLLKKQFHEIVFSEYVACDFQRANNRLASLLLQDFKFWLWK